MNCKVQLNYGLFSIVGSGICKLCSIKIFRAVQTSWRFDNALRKYMFSQIAVETRLRIDCIQPRDGRCNTGSRADSARNSVFKDPKSLLFAGARDSVAGWLGRHHGRILPAHLSFVHFINWNSISSGIWACGVVVGNTAFVADRVGSNPSLGKCVIFFGKNKRVFWKN